MAFWRYWAEYSFLNGPGRIYESKTDYFPVFLYTLWGFAEFQGSSEALARNINYIKVVPLVFDFIAAFSIYYLVPRRQWRFYLPMVLLFNVAYLYNDLIWGQVDAIPCTIALLALIAALRDRPVWAAALLVLALNTKLQALVFIPFVGLLWLASVWRRPREAAYSLLAVAVLQIAILLPLILEGTTGELWRVAFESVDKYPRVSMNALNFWWLVYDIDPAYVDDPDIWYVLSHKHSGYVLFFGSSLLVMLPWLQATWRRFRKGPIGMVSDDSEQSYYRLTVLTVALAALLFFFFNTQMHERYAHPAILLLFVYAVLRRSYWLYALASVAYFLNLEYVLHYLELPNYRTVVFHGDFVASLFAIVLVVGGVVVWRWHLTRAAT